MDKYKGYIGKGKMTLIRQVSDGPKKPPPLKKREIQNNWETTFTKDNQTVNRKLIKMSWNSTSLKFENTSVYPFYKRKRRR